MRPLIFVCMVALVAGLFAVPAAAQQPAVATTISGSGLPHPITLTAIDQAAFLGRIDLPPLFDYEPVVDGPLYSVTSSYWDVAIRDGDKDEPAVSDTAQFYADSGIVLAKQGARQVWTVLDTKQRAILDRYIKVAAALPEAPLALDVLKAGAQSGETIGITIGSTELTAEQRTKFWDAVSGLKPAISGETVSLSAADPVTAWIVFDLPEGRTIRMLYSGTLHTLAEPTEGPLKFYRAPAGWLTPVVGSSSNLQPLQIEQDPSTGSLAWWVIAFGGGLACISAAFFVQRRITVWFPRA